VREPRLRLPDDVAAALPVECADVAAGTLRLVDISRRGLRLSLTRVETLADNLSLRIGRGRGSAVIEAAVCWLRRAPGGDGEAGLRVHAHSLVAWHALLHARVLSRIPGAAALLPLRSPPDRQRIVMLVRDRAAGARIAAGLRARGLPATPASHGDVALAGADVVVAGPYPSAAAARPDLARSRAGATGPMPLFIAIVPGADAASSRRLVERDGAFDCVTARRWDVAVEIRLAAALRIADQVRESEALIEELVEISGRDPLTGLFNRRQFFGLAADEQERARRNGEPLALALLDLDHFKQVNDLYGHQAGDVVLRAVADLLQSRLRPFDLVARYGGEEFVLLLPGADLAGGGQAVERIRALIEAAPFDGQAIVRLTASVGLVASEPPHPHAISALVAAADRALYRAKYSGRNQVRMGTVTAGTAQARASDS
jgi:diguanylate cyclase (GGDEF)-like protein